MSRDMTQISEPTGLNPFASSTSSPVAEDCFISTHKSSEKPHSTVELEIKRDSLTSAPRIQPAPPPRAHRQSYQSSRHSSRPVSQLPRITDPEKAVDNAELQRWQNADDGFGRSYFYENAAEINAKCLRVLLYLSGPVFLTSTVLAIWTLLALLLSLLLHPVNALRGTKTLREQTISLIAPALKIHLSSILSFVRDDTYASYSLPCLIAINCLAPLMSVVVVLSAWTAACFWCYAVILGDPEGLDRESRRSSYLKEDECEDGKASALRVRRWWRGVLVRALR